MAETVLGIDPGTQRAGWALVGRCSDGRAMHVASGAWSLGGSRVEVADRLVRLREEVAALLLEFRPEMLAIESAFFGKNARSALRLGEARGVVLLTAREQGMTVLELAPALVKRRVTGAGAASKEQVARLVAAQLDLDEAEFDCADQSDAIAVALCGLIESQASASSVAGRKSGLPRGASLQ
ncbi:MAG: crossover junction endodeoxyribonuclease RuvC [Planctomycetes bacterium]|nr:crossover junction endodeoxyribonuclease RuvC [Planctomycetota bacterium]